MLNKAFIVIGLTLFVQFNIQAGDDFVELVSSDDESSVRLSPSISSQPLQELRQRKPKEASKGKTTVEDNDDEKPKIQILNDHEMINDYTQKTPLSETEKQQAIEEAEKELQDLKNRQQELEQQHKILEQKEAALKEEVQNLREALQALMRPGYARYINPVTVLVAGGIGVIHLYEAHTIAGAIGTALYIIYLFRLLQGVYVQGYTYLS